MKKEYQFNKAYTLLKLEYKYVIPMEGFRSPTFYGSVDPEKTATTHRISVFRSLT